MREVILTILWFSFLGQRVLREPGLATARALQNSSSVDAMSFGKVHFAQEPSKTEDSAASTLKSRAVTHSEWEGGGSSSRQASAPQVGPGSPGQLKALSWDSVCAEGSILRWLREASDLLAI